GGGERVRGEGEHVRPHPAPLALREVLALEPRVVVVVEVVDPHRRVAAVDERVGQVRADEARVSRDEDARLPPVRLRRAGGRQFRAAAARIASRLERSGFTVSSASMFGPSDGAWSGSSCTSVNSASMPTATAARASAGTSRRSPPERSPSPPGRWTECVASKTTGCPNERKIGSERKSTTSAP